MLPLVIVYRNRPSAFAELPVVERASLARPSLSGCQHRACGYAYRLSSQACSRATRSIRRPRPGGSRVVTWQLCKLATAESLRGRQAAPEHGPALGSSMGGFQIGASSERILPACLRLGSSREPPVYPERFRWLPSDRTAILRSGSPPSLGRATTPCSLGGQPAAP